MPTYTVPEDELRKQAKADGMTHLSTGVAVVHDGKILVVRRAADDFPGGNYELPGGGIEDDETFAEAVAREVHEETGLIVTTVLGMFPGFDYSTPNKPNVRQFNFLVNTANSNVALSPEHDQYIWLEAESDIDQLVTTESMKTCMRDGLAVAVDLKDGEGN